jgi:hypothetical protein
MMKIEYYVYKQHQYAIFIGSPMALRARQEDENGIEWSGDQQAEVGVQLVREVRWRKPTQVRPADGKFTQGWADFELKGGKLT